jgi:hypothetical protein
MRIAQAYGRARANPQLVAPTGRFAGIIAPYWQHLPLFFQ